LTVPTRDRNSGRLRVWSISEVAEEQRQSLPLENFSRSADQVSTIYARPAAGSEATP
jgi:hypothetical protein